MVAYERSSWCRLFPGILCHCRVPSHKLGGGWRSHLMNSCRGTSGQLRTRGTTRMPPKPRQGRIEGRRCTYVPASGRSAALMGANERMGMRTGETAKSEREMDARAPTGWLGWGGWAEALARLGPGEMCGCEVGAIPRGRADCNECPPSQSRGKRAGRSPSAALLAREDGDTDGLMKSKASENGRCDKSGMERWDDALEQLRVSSSQSVASLCRAQPTPRLSVAPTDGLLHELAERNANERCETKPGGGLRLAEENLGPGVGDTVCEEASGRRAATSTSVGRALACNPSVVFFCFFPSLSCLLRLDATCDGNHRMHWYLLRCLM